MREHVNDAPRLREEPRFARLLASDFVSGVGDQLNRVAVLALVYQVSGSGYAVSAVLVARMLATIVAAPFGAVLADWLPRRDVLVASGLVRMLVALAMVFSHGLVLLIALVALLEALSALSTPARSALIPHLVRENRVMWANGLDQSMFGLIMAVGSFAGGAALALIGTSGAFVANSVSFLLSSFLLLGLPRGVPRGGAEKRDRRLLAALPALADPGLRLSVLLSAVWPLAGGALSVLITAYSFDTFHAGGFGIGLLYSALGAGYLVGGVAIGRLTVLARVRPARIAPVSFAVEGVCHVLVSQSPTLWLATGLLFAGACSAACGNAAIGKLLMGAPDDVRGRVIGISKGLAACGQITSMAVAGVLLEAAGVRPVGFGSGALLVVLVVVTGWLVRR